MIGQKGHALKSRIFYSLKNLKEFDVHVKQEKLLESHLRVALLHEFPFPVFAQTGQELLEHLHRLPQRRLLVVLAHVLPGLVFFKLKLNKTLINPRG